jgi:hypothetical protein
MDIASGKGRKPCQRCGRALDGRPRGNTRYHPECAREQRKETVAAAVKRYRAKGGAPGTGHIAAGGPTLGPDLVSETGITVPAKALSGAEISIMTSVLGHLATSASLAKVIAEQGQDHPDRTNSDGAGSNELSELPDKVLKAISVFASILPSPELRRSA